MITARSPSSCCSIGTMAPSPGITFRSTRRSCAACPNPKPEFPGDRAAMARLPPAAPLHHRSTCPRARRDGAAADRAGSGRSFGAGRAGAAQVPHNTLPGGRLGFVRPNSQVSDRIAQDNICRKIIEKWSGIRLQGPPSSSISSGETHGCFLALLLGANSVMISARHRPRQGGRHDDDACDRG